MMRKDIECIVPNFYQISYEIFMIKKFGFTRVESYVVAMMLKDWATLQIAELFQRSYKTINAHQLSSLKKTKCNTFFAMALEINKYLKNS